MITFKFLNIEKCKIKIHILTFGSGKKKSYKVQYIEIDYTYERAVTTVLVITNY